MSDHKYTVKVKPLPIDNVEMNYGVISKFSRKAMLAGREIEDKMFLILLNDKPPRMKQETWNKMLKKVLRAEVIDNHIVGGWTE